MPSSEITSDDKKQTYSHNGRRNKAKKYRSRARPKKTKTKQVGCLTHQEAQNTLGNVKQSCSRGVNFGDEESNGTESTASIESFDSFDEEPTKMYTKSLVETRQPIYLNKNNFIAIDCEMVGVGPHGTSSALA